MKPPEILSMIEEAAGTRMYEAKKQQAEKTIEKKDARLKEINDILNEEINPTLKKLREERSGPSSILWLEALPGPSRSSHHQALPPSLL